MTMRGSIMANIIRFGTTKCPEPLCMSNGLTDVFINVLVLSGSSIAKTDSEKRLIVWLAEKDQSRVGMGTVGFDICEMPWNRDTFEGDRDFLVKTIEGAENKSGWELLDYAPNEKMLFPCLSVFKELVQQISEKDIHFEEGEKWLAEAGKNDPVICGFPLCEKHCTLLTVFGCQLCNN